MILPRNEPKRDEAAERRYQSLVRDGYAYNLAHARRVDATYFRPPRHTGEPAVKMRSHGGQVVIYG